MGNVRGCRDCGSPLSRYNPDERCSPCATTARRRPSRPVELPAGFALDAEIRAALEAGEWATVLQAVHTVSGATQTDVAVATGLSQPHISRLMAGKVPDPTLATVRALCDGLGIPRIVAGLAPAATDTPEVTTDRRAFLTAAAALSAVSFAPLAELAAMPTNTIGLGDACKLRTLAGEITALDNTHGGDVFCDAAVRAVEHADHLLQFGSYSARVGREIQTAVAELSDAAGWAYYDANQQQRARYWYQQALTNARLIEDLRLEVIVLCELSMQAVFLGRAREGVQFAELAERQAAGWAPPRVVALTLLRQASGHGAGGDVQQAQRLMSRARNVYQPGRHQDDPEWIDFLDPAEVTSLEAAVYAGLGEHHRAARLLDDALIQRHGEFPRNETFFRVRLAEELANDGRIEEACATAVEALPAVARLHSTRTKARASAFFAGMAGHRSRAARDAVERAQAAGLVA